MKSHHSFAESFVGILSLLEPEMDNDDDLHRKLIQDRMPPALDGDTGRPSWRCSSTVAERVAITVQRRRAAEMGVEHL